VVQRGAVHTFLYSWLQDDRLPTFPSLLILDRLGCLCQSFHLESLGSLEELGELVLSHIHLSGIHELQDGSQVLERNILQNDDGVFCWILFQKCLEVGAAGRQNHLVGLGALPVAGDGHIRERLLVPEVLEAGHHVGLEVVPSQAKLLLIVHF